MSSGATHARSLTAGKFSFLHSLTISPVSTIPRCFMLTLSAARSLAFDPNVGKLVGSSKGWSRDAARYLDVAIDKLSDPVVQELQHTDYKRFWIGLAKEHLANRRKYGSRAVEMIIANLRSTVVWLAEEKHIPRGYGLPAPDWKTEMFDDWSRVTGKSVTPPNKPRYSEDEAEKLWGYLPKAPPRLRLAIEIGAELRLGQLVERTRRSDILPHGDHAIGLVQVHGAGKKQGTNVVLTDEQRGAIIDAMTVGYLSTLETLFQERKLSDYVLITGGYFLKGKAQAKYAKTPLSARVMRKQWHHFETLAGVPHVPGRGWYGLRRAADDARRGESDSTLINALGRRSVRSTRKTSAIVKGALKDAEHLIKGPGAASAVDRIHTALHGHMLDICAHAAIDIDPEAPVVNLFKVIREQHPAFAEMGEWDAEVKKIVRSLGAVIDALNTLRNNASPAHPNERLDEPEAMLAYNAGLVLLRYLDDRIHPQSPQSGGSRA
jgi:hypothetical protein